jgi:PAS domain S-box-containing protein
MLGLVGLDAHLRSERQLAETTLLAAARGMSVAVDREISRAEAIAMTLAQSPDLRRGDFSSFLDQARPLVQDQGRWLVLVDRTGKQVLNSFLQKNGEFRQHAQLKEVQAVLSTGQVQVSDIFIGRATGKTAFGIHVPVRDGDHINYVLMLGVHASHLQRIIQEQARPSGWSASIVDKSDHIAAREPYLPQFIGNLMRPERLRAMSGKQEGVTEGPSLDGPPVLVAFARAPVSGWLFTIGMPIATYGSTKELSVSWVGIALFGLLLIGLAMALLLSRGIITPLEALTASAERLQRGEAPMSVGLGLPEADIVIEALQTVSMERVRQEQQYRVLTEALPQLVWRLQPGSGVDFINSQVVAYTGREAAALIGFGWLDVVHPADRDHAWQARAEASGKLPLEETELRLRRHDGVYRWFSHRTLAILEADGTATQWISTSTDITDMVEARRLLIDDHNRLDELVHARTEELRLEMGKRQKVEAELAQTQKMEALGQLSGGIAHDFNNLLAVILINMDLLRDHVNDNADADNMIDIVQHAAEQGATLIRQMLALGRRQFLRPTSLHCADVMAEMTQLLRQALGETIRLTFAPEPDVWLLRADHAQFESALLNLVVNARHAMQRGGDLFISARNDTVNTARSGELGLLAGHYVAISVTDTGIGMDTATLARVFEPFFTTKGVGEGSGLGLSQVYGFAKQSGGAAAVDSMLGKGTTVTLWLPRDHYPEAVAPQPKQAAIMPIGIDKTVLIVEDRFDLLMSAKAAIETLGFETKLAASSQEALRILESDERVDLLFTDIVLPGDQDGVNIAYVAQEMRPSLRVLVTTGYAREESLIKSLGAFTVLPKPYDIATLCQHVARALH